MEVFGVKGMDNLYVFLLGWVKLLAKLLGYTPRLVDTFVSRVAERISFLSVHGK